MRQVHPELRKLNKNHNLKFKPITKRKKITATIEKTLNLVVVFNLNDINCKKSERFWTRKGLKHFNILNNDFQPLIQFIDANKEIIIEKETALTKFAKKLNNNLPKSEVWFNKIKDDPIYNEYEFQHNVPLFNTYIYDLFSKKYRVAIEVDGSYHDRQDQKIKDAKKDALCFKKNILLIRVKAFDETSYNECIDILNKIIQNSKGPNMKPIRQLIDIKKRINEKSKKYWMYKIENGKRIL